MENFNTLGLPEALNKALKDLEFTTPTPIQAQAIPPALEGRDILGSAQTGTGKTIAFGIPLVTKLMNDSRGSALVMAPTRELATQVMMQIRAILGRNPKIKTALLIGGESMQKQLQQLRNRPRIFVGTPGRINDHLERGSLILHDTNFLVLDETDRMLDMGFSVQIERVIKFMPKTRQTLLFSATLPKNIVQISNKYMVNPVRVAVDATSSPAQNIKQEVIYTSESEKYNKFLDELNSREGSIIVFVKTKYGTEKMARKLSAEGHSADAIHGNLRQNKRDRVIAAFRKQKYRILVATDVASRGLDIPHIEHVINYDLPQCPEDYIHRIGRTARAGAEGESVCFVTPSEKSKWNAIDRLLNPGRKSTSSKYGIRRMGGNGNGNSSGGGESAPRRNSSRGSRPGSRYDNRRDNRDNDGNRYDNRRDNDGNRYDSRNDTDGNRYDSRNDTDGNRYDSRRDNSSSRGRSSRYDSKPSNGSGRGRRTRGGTGSGTGRSRRAS